MIGRRHRDVRLAPLGWVLLAVLVVAAGVLGFGPRSAEGPVLALVAVVLLAVVRGVSAERFGADRRGPPAIARFGLLSTALHGDQLPAPRHSGLPAEPLDVELDELDQDLLLLQERQRIEAARRGERRER
jgi:hypothetical protein